MIANPTNVGISQRAVATLVAIAVLLFSLGIYTSAQAANLTLVSNTLTDSDLSALSGHEFAFTIPVGSDYDDAGDITITFPQTPGSGFTGVAASVIGNFSATVNGTAATIDSFDSTGQVVTLSLNTSATAGQEIVVVLVPGIVTNPDAEGSSEFTITAETSGAPDDLINIGKTQTAIIANVLVTAIVNTQFTFDISGLATSTLVNGTSTTGSTTATTIDFGELTAGIAERLAQRLNVVTNARSGFIVTVESDGDLQSSNGAIIDTFIEGSDQFEPDTVWQSPSPVISDETTWGHWGMTTDDANLAADGIGAVYASEFAANEYIGVTTTPREVFRHTGPSNGLDANNGEVDVMYQIEITALQEAADDYNTTLTYIATPIF